MSCESEGLLPPVCWELRLSQARAERLFTSKDEIDAGHFVSKKAEKIGFGVSSNPSRSTTESDSSLRIRTFQ